MGDKAMSRVNPRVVLGLAGLFLALCAPAAAADQDASRPAPSSGPLVLAPVSSDLVFSTDMKVTTVNGATAILAGAYVGKLIEKRVLIAAGTYWLAKPRDTARMFYAGLVLGGRLAGTDPVNLSARGLFGIGHATLYETFAAGEARLPHHHGKAFGGPIRFGASDDFWIADPELRFAWALTPLISFDLGAGYRVTTARDGLNEPLRGPTGSMGIRFNME
jgi:hypothetical protein